MRKTPKEIKEEILRQKKNINTGMYSDKGKEKSEIIIETLKWVLGGTDNVM